MRRHALPRPNFKALLGALLAVGAASCAADQEATRPDPAPAAATTTSSSAAGPAAWSKLTAAEWNERLARYARPELTADLSKLPESERAALMEIIEASKLLEPIFDRQAWAKNPELLAALEKEEAPEAKLALEYVRVHRGPWDRQEHFAPFAVDFPRPPGAGFYPEDLTKEELKAWLEAHPEDREAFEGLFTIIRRDGDRLVAIPYSEAYAEWLKPAAERLRAAAKLTKNASLAKFLNSRADAFLSDDYYQSDKDWMDLDGLVEVIIGPYEVYEDNLFAYKASFESFVTVSDPEASKQLARFKELLPAMEQNLPVPDEVKAPRGAESPIRVVDLVFTAGDARKSVQTIAFNLPNDERVRAEKGAKKVLLRNAIQTKFDTIMRPIGERILVDDQLQYLSGDAFFHEVLFHELSHSLGPAFTEKDGKKVEVRIALENTYSAIEEAKADVMGAYNILFLIEKGELPEEMREKLLVSYFAGLFRSVRFGVSEAHGQGAAMQINRMLEAGGATFDDGAGRFRVDLAKLEQGITELVRELCMLQHAGDKAAAEALLAKYGVMSPPMEKALAKLDGIPVDIRPVFPVAGETR